MTETHRQKPLQEEYTIKDRSYVLPQVATPWIPLAGWRSPYPKWAFLGKKELLPSRACLHMPGAFTETFLSRTATCFQGRPLRQTFILLEDSRDLIAIPAAKNRERLMVGLFSLEKGGSEGVFSVCVTLWWWGGNKTEPDFSVVPSGRTKHNGHMLKYRKFHLNIRKINKYIYIFNFKCETQEQVADAGCGVSALRDNSKSNWTRAWATCFSSEQVGLD